MIASADTQNPVGPNDGSVDSATVGKGGHQEERSEPTRQGSNALIIALSVTGVIFVTIIIAVSIDQLPIIYIGYAELKHVSPLVDTEVVACQFAIFNVFWLCYIVFCHLQLQPMEQRSFPWQPFTNILFVWT